MSAVVSWRPTPQRHLRIASADESFEVCGSKKEALMHGRLPRRSGLLVALALTLSAPIGTRAQSTPKSLGVFESQADVGSVTPPGKLAYDAGRRVYTIDSAGANLWSTEDGFHFVWKRFPAMSH